MNKNKTAFFTTLAFMCLSVSVAAAETTLSGMARLIDGDTIAIGTQVIRLQGIDAPENGQNCLDQNGREYNCGGQSEKHLETLITGKVVCSGETFDPYQRLIASCLSAGIDLNQQMVLDGQAFAFRKFSQAYVMQEDLARQAGRGIWAGKFEFPWDYRNARWHTASRQAPSNGCPIKGNINRQGEKIYHAPWSRSYERTRIDTSRSERWFCSEAEALAAGWRAPRQAAR